MRPIRVTGVTGNSNPVPLDVYSEGLTMIDLQGGTGAVQITLDSPYDIASASLTWKSAPTKDATTGLYTIPQGVRAVRGTGMAPTDVLVVSQQGIR
jgi:hypothetical protein